MRPPPRQAGFSLVELLIAVAIGLLLSGAMLQALLAEGRNSEWLVRRLRERSTQRRTLDLVRGDVLRTERLTLGATTSPCGLGGRRPVLSLSTAEGTIVYTEGAAPSPIWRGRVLMRCGPAYGLYGEPSAGAFLNRVLIDGLPTDGFVAEIQDTGLLRVRLRQEFAVQGSLQRIESERVLGTGPPS